MDLDMGTAMGMDIVPDNEGLKQMLCGHVHGHSSAWHAREPISIYLLGTSVPSTYTYPHLGLHLGLHECGHGPG